MRSLNVAVLDEELPFPLTSGKRIRTYNLLARLADRHRVTVFCHRNPDRDEAAAAEAAFRELGIETVVVDRAVPAKSGPTFYARLAGNLLSPLPYSVATHASLALADAVRQFAADNRVDVWHCEWTPYAQVLRDALGDDLGQTRVDRDGSQRRVAYLAAVYGGRGEPREALVHPTAVAEVRAVRAVGVFRRHDTARGQSRRREAHARTIRRRSRGGRREWRRCRLLPPATRRRPRPGKAPLPGQPRLAAEPRRRLAPSRRHLPEGAASRFRTRRSRWSAAARRSG